jgi:hypothetical protein
MTYSTQRRNPQVTARNNPVRVCFIVIMFTALAMASQGCVLTPIQRVAPGSDQSTPFVPPSPAPQNTPTSDLSIVAPQRPTPTVPCSDGLTYLADLTIPDGSVIQPGASIDKRWEVKNSGTCNWEAGYSLRLIAGSDLGTNPEQALLPARSETNVIIRIIFQAPSETGSYRSAWQAHNPDGQPFGDPIFMEINVSEP